MQLGGTISRRSKLPNTVALSSCELEIVALSLTICDALAIKQLLQDIVTEKNFNSPAVIMEDNKGPVDVAKNASHYTRSS